MPSVANGPQVRAQSGPEGQIAYRLVGEGSDPPGGAKCGRVVMLADPVITTDGVAICGRDS